MSEVNLPSRGGKEGSPARGAAAKAGEKGRGSDGRPAGSGKLGGFRARLAGLGASGREPLLDVVITAPVFVIYHVGVIFLTVRNAFDPITGALLEVLHRSLLAYLGITVGLAVGLFLLVRLTSLKGKLSPLLFGLRVGEGAIYAVLMCLVAKTVVAHTLSATKGDMDAGTALVMSMGAGFYEELTFRVIAFGVVVWLLSRRKAAGAAVRWPLEIIWALVTATAFSAVHYIGSMSDDFHIGSFVFRLVCGLFLTAVFRFRGFATAVWTHALYDVGVMVF